MTIDISNTTQEPFADVPDSLANGGSRRYVHIRIQQRNARKILTTIQGLSAEFDARKICRACKREFDCNGTVIGHVVMGDIIQLQGDQRENAVEFLTKNDLARKDLIKVHGF